MRHLAHPPPTGNQPCHQSVRKQLCNLCHGPFLQLLLLAQHFLDHHYCSCIRPALHTLRKVRPTLLVPLQDHCAPAGGPCEAVRGAGKAALHREDHPSLCPRGLQHSCHHLIHISSSCCDSLYSSNPPLLHAVSLSPYSVPGAWLAPWVTLSMCCMQAVSCQAHQTILYGHTPL